MFPERNWFTTAVSEKNGSRRWFSEKHYEIFLEKLTRDGGFPEKLAHDGRGCRKLTHVGRSFRKN
jgi:hypothetical protein